MKDRITSLFGRAFLATVVFALASTAAFGQTGSMRVFHGIPGADVSPDVDPALPVDVLVNDAICLLSGFNFGDVAGPFTLPEGTYNVKISLANTLEPCSGDAVIEGDIPLAAGENATVVAHLTEMGMPTASKFVNDATAPMMGNARLIAHHLAAAPAVDLVIRGGFPPSTLLTVPGVVNGGQAAAEAPDGNITVGVVPAGGTSAIFVRGLRLRAGAVYTAYAVGSLENGTFTIFVLPLAAVPGPGVTL